MLPAIFKALANWWRGELIEVTIFDVRKEMGADFYPHTVVSCPDGTRQWVGGLRGKAGEEITVNTWELNNF